MQRNPLVYGKRGESVSSESMDMADLKVWIAFWACLFNEEASPEALERECGGYHHVDWPVLLIGGEALYQLVVEANPDFHALVGCAR